MNEPLYWRCEDQATNSVRELRCAQCGGRAELFQLRDAVWQATQLPKDGLNSWACLACVEAALQRELTVADFAPFPWYAKDCPEYYRGISDGVQSAVTSSLAMFAKYRMGLRLGTSLATTSAQRDIDIFLRDC